MTTCTLERPVRAATPAAERTRFSQAFADLYQAIGEGKVQPASMQGLQRELLTLSSEVDRGLTREQVLRLTEAVEDAAGKSQPSPGRSP